MTTTSVETLPVLPLPDGVVLPDMVVTVALQSKEANEAVRAATLTARRRPWLVRAPLLLAGAGFFDKLGFAGDGGNTLVVFSESNIAIVSLLAPGCR